MRRTLENRYLQLQALKIKRNYRHLLNDLPAKMRHLQHG
uniref:Uncharacterized protein n=1 Tax=Rhizophora mucronata TaxID=61149 RepID=A0A2P2QTG2_RHIMU